MKREFESLSLRASQELIRAVLSEGNRFRFTAHGVSMSPFIRDGDVIELVFPKKVRFGAVVAVANGEKLLVHRVMRVKNGAVLLKGDHVRDCDGWFDRDQLLGRTVRVEHRGKEQKIGVTRFCRIVAILSSKNLLGIFLRIFVFFCKKNKKSA